MAKKSMIVKNQKRVELAKKFEAKRKSLVAILKNEEASIEDKMEASARLSKLPKNSSKIRVRNRCALTGRPRGYMKFFDLSRIAFRELASDGKLPGVKKTSW